jgi:tetratricopeptide (TPR) repeat protein
MESYQLSAQGDPHVRAEGLGALGYLALLRGDLAQAHSLLHEATKIVTAANYLQYWQQFLGIVVLYEGDAAEARRLLHENLRLCVELKYQSRLAQVYTFLAEVALSEGELEQAAQWLAQSLAHQADARQITLGEAWRLLVAARLATAQQRYARAATLFGLAEMAHNRVHHAIGGPARAMADAALASVRGALDSSALDEAYAAGQQMSLERAFSTVLAPSVVAGGHGDPAPIAGID